MKTKITLLLTFCLILSSCIKDFYGHPDDKNGVLTETNYFYSDDFKTEFLEIKIDELDKELKELSPILEQNPNDSITQQKFDLATQERGEASAQINIIEDTRDIVYKRRPRIPSPCPIPQSCFPGIQYFAVSPQVEIFKCVVIDANGNVIGKTEGNVVPLDNVDGLLNYVVFMFDKPDFNGEVQIQITEQLSTEEGISEFTLDSYIGE